MAQTGYTPIQLYYSTTAAAVPTAGNLANGELAINITDGKLYYKNNSGVVTLIAGSSAGPAGGSNTQVQYNSSGVLAGSANMTFDGTTLTLGANPILSGGTANGVAYLNGSKAVTSGSALTYNGTTLTAVNNATAVSIALSRTSATARDYALGIDGDGGFRLTDSTSSIVILSSLPSLAFLASQGELAFKYNSTTEGMRLTSAGLGIGTSSPAYKLDVSSSAEVVGRFARSASSNALLLIQDPTTTTAPYIGSYGNAMAFGRYGGGESMRIDSSGNLGLGVTPSAWESILRAEQFGYSGSIVGGTAANNVSLNNNWYSTTAGVDTRINAGYATRYTQNASGQHGWYISATSTAGSSISFTQAMTLDESGNLGIGTSSPTARLQINGTTDATQRIIVGGTGNTSSYKIHYNGSEVGFIQNYQNTEMQLGTTVAATLAFSTNNTQRFIISTAGALGIGTTPSYGTAGQVLTSNGSGSAPSWQAAGGSSQWTTSGSNIYYTTGSVGIGTTSPNTTLDVLSGSANTSGDSLTDQTLAVTGPNRAFSTHVGILNVATNTAAGIDVGGSIGFGGRWSGTSQAGYALIKGAKETSATSYASYLAFYTRPDSAAMAERMRITSAGNVGMGNLGATGYSNGQLTVGGASGNYATLALSTEPSLGIAGVRAFDGTTGSVMCVAFQAYGGYSANAPRSDGKGNTAPAPGYNMSWSTWPTSYGYWVEAFSVDPLTYFKPGQDNARSLGTSSSRWSVVYAATGSINTSDINVKEQIAPLDDAEKRVATAIKGLIKKFKFKDAVQEKGENARIHVGVIAQEVSAAFVAEGLDPTRYALFCEDTWWQKESFEQLDEVDETAKSLKIEYFKEETEGCTAHTRLGIRYDELFAFLIATL